MNFISNEYCDFNGDMSSQDFLKGLMNQDSFSDDYLPEEVNDYDNGIRKFGTTYNMINEE